ncbi:NADH-quinone oxidoreductase subunit C [Candidatus Fermentibacterales bacterium]|nr:NADH-quinone oxidoreductase subunit C [Candidatus Fermentibacterales bacterium]
MTREEVLKDIRSKFEGEILDFCDKSPHRVYMEIRPEAIVPMASHLFLDLGARFNIASGMDMMDRIEILYHHTLEDLNLMISLRVRLDRDNPEIDSMGAKLEAYNWIEREIAEILGVRFRGHPDMRHLLLADNWPDGVYPLRQDYEEWDPSAIRDRGV